jgi:hypothetical protein
LALLLKDSISPLPLHKSLVLLDRLRFDKEERCYQHMLLALANALVFKISNLYFGPEVGVQSPTALSQSNKALLRRYGATSG